MVAFPIDPAKAIDEYASLKSKAAESKNEADEIDPRLEAIVERMLDKYVMMIHYIFYIYISICSHWCSGSTAISQQVHQ